MRGERGRACGIGRALEQRLQRGGVCEQGSIAAVEVKQGVIAGEVGHVQSGRVGNLYIQLSAQVYVNRARSFAVSPVILAAQRSGCADFRPLWRPFKPFAYTMSAQVYVNGKRRTKAR